MSHPKQSVRHITLGRLVGHQNNRMLDRAGLDELAASITEHGILQPLIVTEHPTEYDRWVILGGHRRAAAAKIAGLLNVPCVIRHNLDADPDEQLVVMLVENCQRRDLGPIEKAEAFGALRAGGMTLAEMSRRTGLSEGTISPYLSLLELDIASRERVRAGEVTVRDAIAAVRLVRKQNRRARGEAQAGRPIVAESAWFSKRHKLSTEVGERCDHTNRPTVGGVGCGQCWEAVIREDAGRPAYDEAAVIRRLNGDRTARIRKPDRDEIVRRARAMGWSYKQIEERCGLTKIERYLTVADGEAS